MRWRLGTTLIALAACEPTTWQEVVDDYAKTVCEGLADCGDTGDTAVCIDEIKTLRAQTRAALTADRERNCMACMQTITDVIPDAVERGCVSTPEEEERIYDDCDLDPATDWDGDGNPSNDDGQACDP